MLSACAAPSARHVLWPSDLPRHKHLLPDRYEFLVYRLLRDRQEAGDIFGRESIRFRSFEDDLIEDQRWQEKDQLLAEM